MNTASSQADISTVQDQDVDLGVDEGGKLVPVAESIRYRKRAQSAEQRVEALAEELSQAQRKVSQMSEELDGLRLERQLTRKLLAAGAVDLEAAVLIAKARAAGKDEAELDGCIEQLRRDKGYLFEGSGAATSTTKTAAVKDRVTSTHTTLERAAKRAARSGSRGDLQEYLKLRRSLL